MKSKMNILFSCDENYVMPMTVCLTSVFENNTKCFGGEDYNNIDVYILHSPLLEKQKEDLQNLAKQYAQNLFLIEVDDKYFNNVPTFSWTKETYYSLLINEYLPKELDKILYLDCDTIVNKPLNTLYETDLGENYLGAVEQKDQPKLKAPLGFSLEDQYFNTGVVLFDLIKCREIIDHEKVTTVIKDLGKNFFKADEGVINVMFKGKIKALDFKYNNYLVTNFNSKSLSRLFNTEDHKTIEETYIFHYFAKPWYNLYPASCENIWYKYLRLSPYKYLYTNKYSKFKYKILKLGVVKSILFICLTSLFFIEQALIKILPKRIYWGLKKFYVAYIK